MSARRSPPLPPLSNIRTPRRAAEPEMEQKPPRADEDDVRVALLRQLGIADADLKLVLAAAADSAPAATAATAAAVPQPKQSLSPFRSFCRQVSLPHSKSKDLAELDKLVIVDRG